MVRDIFFDRINKALTPDAIKLIMKYISSYVDENSDILLALNLSKRFSFSDKERGFLYQTITVSEEEFIKAIRESKYINKSNRNHQNPFYHACFLVTHALIKKKLEKEAQLIITFMSMMMYTSIHKGLFHYGANPRIMDYTISMLDKSFQIRSMSSVYEFIHSNAITVYTTYKNRITKADDQDATWVIDATHARLKGKLRKLANAYYKNHENGSYLNLDADSIDPDNLHEIDNDAFAVERLSNKIYIKLLNGQYDRKFIRYSVASSTISEQKIKNLIEDIIETDDSAKRMIQSVIFCYLTMSGNSMEYIAKGDFITFMQKIYTSNTESLYMHTIKDILDKWLDDNQVVLGRANFGKTARANYRKSIYMFFVFIINREAKIN